MAVLELWNLETKVIGNLKMADRFGSRLLGYMFRKSPHYEAIFLTPCNSIHCLFIRFPIDVLCLDGENRVLRKVESLQPWRLAGPVSGARSVVETRAGGFREVRVGDTITVRPVEGTGRDQ